MSRGCITRDEAFRVARNFMSEDGENVEYDRALIEFLADAFDVEHGEMLEDAIRRVRITLENGEA